MANDDCLFIGSHSRLTLPDNLLENNSQRAVHLPHQTKLALCNDYSFSGRKIVRYHIRVFLSLPEDCTYYQDSMFIRLKTFQYNVVSKMARVGAVKRFWEEQVSVIAQAHNVNVFKRAGSFTFCGNTVYTRKIESSQRV
jgi:hypothetical protein